MNFALFVAFMTTQQSKTLRDLKSKVTVPAKELDSPQFAEMGSLVVYSRASAREREGYGPGLPLAHRTEMGTTDLPCTD